MIATLIKLAAFCTKIVQITPVFATLTDAASATPLFATLTKNKDVGCSVFHIGNSRSHRSLPLAIDVRLLVFSLDPRLTLEHAILVGRTSALPTRRYSHSIGFCGLPALPLLAVT